METPHIIRQTELRVAIEHCWGKTIWGYRKSKIVGEDLADGQPITFDWVGYMAKLGTKHKNPRTNKTEFTLHKDDYSQSFDWENSRI